MSEWIQCPNCGTMMTVTTSGYLCPMCGTVLPVKILHMTSGTSPTVDAVPVIHGKWINKYDGIEGAWCFCSVCGKQSIELYDFCPNCGARMDAERKEE